MHRFSGPCLAVLFLIASVVCRSQETKQDKESTFFFRNIKTSYLLNSDIDSSRTISFSSIKFIDARFDTTAIGYTLGKRAYRKLATKEPLASYLTSMFKSSASNEASLLCVIQNFWMIGTDSLIDRSHDKKQFTNALSVRIDAFVQDNQLFRSAFRYDTIIADFGFGKINDAAIINVFLDKLSIRINKVNTAKTLLKKPYALMEINEGILEKYNLPILRDTIYNKGVYSSFSEFTNNKPGYKEFTIDKKEIAERLLIKKEDGSTFYAKEVFGYSDGKNVWLKFKNNFFLLHRSGDGFSFLGFGSLVKKTGVNVLAFFTPPLVINGQTARGPDPFPTYDATDSLRPFILDMEKGGIF